METVAPYNVDDATGCRLKISTLNARRLAERAQLVTQKLLPETRCYQLVQLAQTARAEVATVCGHLGSEDLDQLSPLPPASNMQADGLVTTDAAINHLERAIDTLESAGTEHPEFQRNYEPALWALYKLRHALAQTLEIAERPYRTHAPGALGYVLTQVSHDIDAVSRIEPETEVAVPQAAVSDLWNAHNGQWEMISGNFVHLGPEWNVHNIRRLQQVAEVRRGATLMLKV